MNIMRRVIPAELETFVTFIHDSPLREVCTNFLEAVGDYRQRIGNGESRKIALEKLFSVVDDSVIHAFLECHLLAQQFNNGMTFQELANLIEMIENPNNPHAGVEELLEEHEREYFFHAQLTRHGFFVHRPVAGLLEDNASSDDEFDQFLDEEDNSDESGSSWSSCDSDTDERMNI